MTQKYNIFLFALLFFFITCYKKNVYAQNPTQSTFPINGIVAESYPIYALTQATIFTDYNKKIENATLLVQKGKIIGVGTQITIPQNAIVLNYKGKYIYPSFIEIYATDYGMPEVKKARGDGDQYAPQFVSNKKGAFGWNEAIRPETAADELFAFDEKNAETYRQLGFGAAVSHLKDGIARGTSVATLLTQAKENELIIKPKVAAHYSFSKGSSSQDYPSSQMGSIALLRQTYLDAQWYAQVKEKNLSATEYNVSLENWLKQQTLPAFFEASDVLSLLRADKVGDEFGIQYVMKTAGDEYQRLNELKATNAALIVPLNFPAAFDVETPFDAQKVSLNEMKHWELAPSNPAFLAKNNLTFALTTADLKDKKKFDANLQKALTRGLTHEQALKALTATPATLAGLQNQLGSLTVGKFANFLVCSDSLFKEKTELNENWVKGTKYELKKINRTDLRGKYSLNIDNKTYKMEIEGTDPNDLKVSVFVKDTTKNTAKLLVENQNVTLIFNPIPPDTTAKEDAPKTANVRLNGWLIDPNGKQWKGTGQNSQGEWVKWTAQYTDSLTAKKEPKNSKDKTSEKDKPKDKKTPELGIITYPFTAYGWETEPKNETVLFKNATVWTNEAEGILKNTDVLIENGKIVKIGKDLPAPPQAKTVNAENKHLTVGIIDEHSHIAISKGVNESAQNSTAEVRIGDVVNSEDVNIYRNLAGGVVACQLLHGSANPIGGQSAIIKLRWGFAPEKMKLANAPGFIKFALGENVKQSNWGDQQTIRYPQTRMGVEQTYMDYFTRALEYQENMKNKNLTTRRDLELETLAEILNKKRFITCHSYVQSEITMLMRVAEKFNFRINTFTHILEGYKIADKMKKHGVNASTFSDWWAYKYEVVEAIPHNAAILQKMGVNVCINSDDAEMARRLNQEAAKAVKYGNVPEEEAWKMVTLNPAKALHLDAEMGSIKVGKSADLVLWSNNPLSVYAKAEQTYVDGICFFDIQTDQKLQNQIKAERHRLIQKMNAEKQKGGDTQKPKGEHQRLYHCDSEGEAEWE